MTGQPGWRARPLPPPPRQRRVASGRELSGAGIQEFVNKKLIRRRAVRMAAMLVMNMAVITLMAVVVIVTVIVMVVIAVRVIMAMVIVNRRHSRRRLRRQRAHEAAALGVNDALRDALAVELSQLLDQVAVMECCNAVVASGQ